MPVMVCMDGFILTHAYERVDIPEQARGRRLPAAVRAAPGARSRRAGLDRRDGRAGGFHGGALPRARTSRSRRSSASRSSPPSSRARFGRDSGGLRAHLPLRGRRDDRRRPGLGDRHDQGHRRRDARRGRQDRRRSASVVPPVPARRGARRAAGRAARRRAREELRASAWAGSRLDRRRASPSRACSCTATRSSPGSADAPITKASLQRTVPQAIADKLEPLHFLDLDWRMVNRELEREAQMRRTGPIAENILRCVGTVARMVAAMSEDAP